jgi:hypothetical protein
MEEKLQSQKSGPFFHITEKKSHLEKSSPFPPESREALPMPIGRIPPSNFHGWGRILASEPVVRFHGRGENLPITPERATAGLRTLRCFSRAVPLSSQSGEMVMTWSSPDPSPHTERRSLNVCR